MIGAVSAYLLILKYKWKRFLWSWIFLDIFYEGYAFIDQWIGEIYFSSMK